MRKAVIGIIVVVLAAFGVFIAIRFSENKISIRENESKTETSETKTELTNPASETVEGEIRLTNENFDKEVREYKGVMLVDMFSPACGYCQQVGPIVSEIAKENIGKYKIGKLNVFVSPEIANEFKVEGYPVLIVFKDGKEVSRIVGAKPKETILQKLEEASK